MGMIGYFLRVTKPELDEYLKDSSLLEDLIDSYDEGDEKLVDIDRSWEGIIFLLTGQCLADADHPLKRILFSGQLIDDDQDLGYGPAHYLTPQQVADLNNEISEIDTAELKQRFDSERMTALGIYPEIWNEGDGAFEYLMGYFLITQQVYKLAAKNSNAIITFIS